jgi:hypothetical protein
MTTGRAALACHQSHVRNPNKSLCRPQSSSASRVTAAAPPSVAQDDRAAHYCEYQSQWTFPSSSPTLAIWTNSSSEHPRAHLSHCCFLPKSRAHASAPANTIWPLRAFTPALMPSASLLLESEVRCRQSSKCLQMFFGLLACCVSCWRGDQQSGQYDHPKHKWHLALRYRHFSLLQSSSASRFTAWRCRPPAPVIREKSQFCAQDDSLSLSLRS